MDATAIDAPDRSFDVAVFALSFHHLPPPLASRVIAEGTRVADKLLIIDMSRWPSVLHVAKLATMAPFCTGAAIRARRIHQFPVNLQSVGHPGAGRIRVARYRR